MLGKSIGLVKKANGDASSLEWANTVTLDGVSAVQMPFGPMDVQAYKSDGVNLLISLNSGDVVTIENFFSTFAEDEESSELVLQDEEGILWRGQFDPVTSEFNFAEIVTLEAGVGSEAASGALLNLPDWAMLGLAVLAVGGGAIAVHNSRSSSSSKDFIPNAPQAPDAPINIKIIGTLITGKTQPGFTVQVTDADGKLLGKEVIADGNGDFQYDILPDELSAEGGSFFVTVVNPDGVSSESTEVVYQPSLDDKGDFEITLDPPVVNDESVTIVVTSPEGDVIQGSGVETPETTPPEKAEGVKTDETGATVTGIAEKGTTVTAQDIDGKEIGSMASLSADEGFNFSVVEGTEELDMFSDEPAELELSLGDVLDFEADTEQLSFFAEEDDSALAPELFGQATHEAALDLTPLVDPLDDVFEQNHSVI